MNGGRVLGVAAVIIEVTQNGDFTAAVQAQATQAGVGAEGQINVIAGDVERGQGDVGIGLQRELAAA